MVQRGVSGSALPVATRVRQAGPSRSPPARRGARGEEARIAPPPPPPPPPPAVELGARPGNARRPPRATPAAKGAVPWRPPRPRPPAPAPRSGRGHQRAPASRGPGARRAIAAEEAANVSTSPGSRARTSPRRGPRTSPPLRREQPRGQRPGVRPGAHGEPERKSSSREPATATSGEARSQGCGPLGVGGVGPAPPIWTVKATRCWPRASEPVVAAGRASSRRPREDPQTDGEDEDGRGRFFTAATLHQAARTRAGGAVRRWAGTRLQIAQGVSSTQARHNSAGGVGEGQIRVGRIVGS